MDDTGCDKCNAIMKIRGSPNLCLNCQIEYWDAQADMAIAMVERLKARRDKIQPPDSKDN